MLRTVLPMGIRDNLYQKQMIRLNVTKVLKQEAAEKARVKPLPKVRVKGSKITPEVKDKVDNQFAQIDKDHFLTELWTEMGQLKRDRGKLSSTIAIKVEEIDTRLTKESPGMSHEFINGKLPMPELADLAEQIQSYTDRMALVWDKIRYVDQYGTLPAEVTQEAVKLELEESSVDVMALHHEIRRLDDLIYKCNKKLQQNNNGIKAPKNTGKVAEWREKIALADARRIDLKLQLKKAQYGAREQRTGEK